MSSRCRSRVVVTALLVLPAVTSVARAGLAEEIVFGLGYIGFDVQGDTNPLSGGVDLLITRDFLGNPLDFGTVEFTGEGPISLDIRTGGRIINGVDIRFQTAIDGNSDSQPFAYSLFVDPASTVTDVDGTLFVDSNFRLNEYGFYDLTLETSVRQTTTTTDADGRTQQAMDSDLGPINVSGNLFVDVLAVVSDPLFDRAGRTNLFASLSGPNSISDVLLKGGNDNQASLASGGNPAKENLAMVKRVGAFEPMAARPHEQFGPFNHPSGQSSAPGQQQGAAVPEPTVLVLLLAGLPAVLGLRRRRP